MLYWLPYLLLIISHSLDTIPNLREIRVVVIDFKLDQISPRFTSAQSPNILKRITAKYKMYKMKLRKEKDENMYAQL